MSTPHRLILFSLGLLALFLPVEAQDSKNNLFQWKFPDNISSQLPTCQNQTITAIPRTNASERGTPPYYMIAFALGGTPRTYFIGEDPDNLQWTPDFPTGTQLLLSVVDTNQGAGGISVSPYTVVDGQLVDCVITDPAKPSFTVAVNVTNTLTTCQPWGITTEGGVPPYIFTLFENGTPNITNVTTTNDEDALVYINRANPNKQLVVAVSDFTGRFAAGTPVVKTQGSADTDCPALNSLTTTTAFIEQQMKDLKRAAADAKRKKSVAIGVSLTFVLLFLLGCAFAYWYIRRRRALPLNLLGHPLSPGQGTSVLLSPKEPKESISQLSEFSAPLSILPPARLQTHITPFNSSVSVTESPASSRSGPSFTTFPMSAAAQAKFAELRAQRNASFSSTMTGTSTLSRNTTDRVIQHEDAEEAIRELPPPYADRRHSQMDDQARLPVSPNPPPVLDAIGITIHEDIKDSSRLDSPIL